MDSVVNSGFRMRLKMSDYDNFVGQWAVMVGKEIFWVRFLLFLVVFMAACVIEYLSCNHTNVL